jgi:hypothetical protein
MKRIINFCSVLDHFREFEIQSKFEGQPSRMNVPHLVWDISITKGGELFTLYKNDL